MIVIQPFSGFCNCLRVVFSYFEYAKSIQSDLTVVWLKTVECNGYFLDYFEDISGITFVAEVPLNTKMQYRGIRVHPKFPPNYSSLRLRPWMQEKITKKLSILGKTYISVHMRRTDHFQLAKQKNIFTTNYQFIDFLNQFPNESIYIATDNLETYGKMKAKFQDRIKFDFPNANPDALRKTTLEDAIIDIYVCIQSKEFMGSGGSTFSRFIETMRESSNKCLN